MWLVASSINFLTHLRQPSCFFNIKFICTAAISLLCTTAALLIPPLTILKCRIIAMLEEQFRRRGRGDLLDEGEGGDAAPAVEPEAVGQREAEAGGYPKGNGRGERGHEAIHRVLHGQEPTTFTVLACGVVLANSATIRTTRTIAVVIVIIRYVESLGDYLVRVLRGVQCREAAQLSLEVLCGLKVVATCSTG